MKPKNINTKPGICSSALLTKHSLVLFSISAEEVQKGNFIRTQRQFEELRKAGYGAYKKLMISFNGYDDDFREIYQISEIRAFVSEMFERYPELDFYLEESAKAPILACLLKTSRTVRTPEGSIGIECPMTDDNNHVVEKLVKGELCYLLKLNK